MASSRHTRAEWRRSRCLMFIIIQQQLGVLNPVAAHAESVLAEADELQKRGYSTTFTLKIMERSETTVFRPPSLARR